MSDDLTQQARALMAHAQDEARAMGHSRVEPEHQLLGLFYERDGVAARVLAERGLTISPVRELARARMGAPGSPNPQRELPLSSEAKEVLHAASRVAFALGQRQAGPEHVLGAMTRLTGSGAFQILRAMQVDPDGIRVEIKKRIMKHDAGEADVARPYARHVGSAPLSP